LAIKRDFVVSSTSTTNIQKALKKFKICRLLHLFVTLVVTSYSKVETTVGVENSYRLQYYVKIKCQHIFCKDQSTQNPRPIIKLAATHTKTA